MVGLAGPLCPLAATALPSVSRYSACGGELWLHRFIHTYSVWSGLSAFSSTQIEIHVVALSFLLPR